MNNACRGCVELNKPRSIEGLRFEAQKIKVEEKGARWPHKFSKGAQ
jgi:hypothetical protein